MAFTGFTDRVVQYPGRVTMVPVQGEANTYDMSRSEGTVTTEGTPFNAATFNSIADDIIQEADDNIITSAELSALATRMSVSPADLNLIIDAIVDRTVVRTITGSDLPITATKGSVTSKKLICVGKVATLHLVVNGTAEPGYPMFEGTLTNANQMPLATVSATTYYGPRAICATLNEVGKIVVRNCGATAIGTAGNAYLSFTFSNPNL